MNLQAIIADLQSKGYSYSAAVSIARAILLAEKREIEASLLQFYSVTRG